MTRISRPVLLLSGPEDDIPSEPAMKFRLIYAGELRPTQRDPVGSQSDPLAVHKHKIRRVFHRQLRHLWKTDKFLRGHTVDPSVDVSAKSVARPSTTIQVSDTGDYVPLEERLAQEWSMFNYNFVPLVRRDLSLLCSLDVLFLRRDPPGSGVVSAGDIDNRIKTLIDALRLPRSPHELVGSDERPGADDSPFYCLLEDDSQVSRLSVEGDVLLIPPDNELADKAESHLVVTVELRPYFVTMDNLAKAGYFYARLSR